MILTGKELPVSIVPIEKEKRLGNISKPLFVRYLADSNRRTWFCRPVPSHSAKVPFTVQ